MLQRLVFFGLAVHGVEDGRGWEYGVIHISRGVSLPNAGQAAGYHLVCFDGGRGEQCLG
jgi:hypothetical protein